MASKVFSGLSTEAIEHASFESVCRRFNPEGLRTWSNGKRPVAGHSSRSLYDQVAAAGRSLRRPGTDIRSDTAWDETRNDVSKLIERTDRITQWHNQQDKSSTHSERRANVLCRHSTQSRKGKFIPEKHQNMFEICRACKT